jgi:hypothetical protein
VTVTATATATAATATTGTVKDMAIKRKEGVALPEADIGRRRFDRGHCLLGGHVSFSFQFFFW